MVGRELLQSQRIIRLQIFRKWSEKFEHDRIIGQLPFQFMPEPEPDRYRFECGKLMKHRYDCIRTLLGSRNADQETNDIA